MKQKKGISYYLLMCLMIGMILFGILFFMVPVGVRLYREYERARIVASYLNVGAELTQAQKDEEKALCVAYNEALYNLQSGTATDTANSEILSTYDERLATTEEMAVIEIPSIGLKIPVYHSSSTAALNKGAGHMQETSLPVGGASTHAVISAHNGDPYTDSFSQIDRLEIGDLFNVTVNGETLTYEVDQIKTVEPADTSEIQIIPGEDHVTLLTCTPRNINSHRLLVRGIRTETVATEDMESGWSETVIYAILGLVVLLILIAVIFWFRGKSKTEKRDLKS